MRQLMETHYAIAPRIPPGQAMGNRHLAVRDGQRVDGRRQWAMGKMQRSIRKGQRAMIATAIAVAVFVCKRIRCAMEVWTVDLWT